MLKWLPWALLPLLGFLLIAWSSWIPSYGWGEGTAKFCEALTKSIQEYPEAIKQACLSLKK